MTCFLFTARKDQQNDQVPFPNRLLPDELENNVLKHMSATMDFRISDVIRLVTGNIPNSATSTYHLLCKKLGRHQVEVKLKSKIAAAEARANANNKESQVIRNSNICPFYD